MRRALALVIALLVVPAVAHADGTTHTINVNKKHKAVVCKAGDTAEITGNGNTVTVTGPCATVRVSGNGNTVNVDTAGAIDTPGNGNTVSWKHGLDGHDAAVSNLGNGNTVSQSK